MDRQLYDPVHEAFRRAARQFLEKEVVPNHERWLGEGNIDKEMFRRAGEQGLLCVSAPEEYGGTGVKDFRYNCVLNEEIQLAGVTSSGFCLTLHNDVCFPYFHRLCNQDQKARWMPGLVDGSLMAALAMTEPSIGSDLASMTTTARLDGDAYVVNGSKTFITNGINADVVIVAVKTDPSLRHKGISLVVVEEGMEGFERGRNLEKIGLKSQDTAELFFTNVRVPRANLLGGEGQGFLHLVKSLPQERLSIAVTALAHSQWAFEETLRYVKEREAFGQPIGNFQNTRFVMATLKTELEIAQVFLDRQIEVHNKGELAGEDAAMSKWWVTELQQRVMDRCLQFHGGYGYMSEYPISRAWADARVQTIYGGTTQIMKEIVGRSLGL